MADEAIEAAVAKALSGGGGDVDNKHSVTGATTMRDSDDDEEDGVLEKQPTTPPSHLVHVPLAATPPHRSETEMVPTAAMPSSRFDVVHVSCDCPAARRRSWWSGVCCGIGVWSVLTVAMLFTAGVLPGTRLIACGSDVDSIGFVVYKNGAHVRTDAGYPLINATTGIVTGPIVQIYDKRQASLAALARETPDVYLINDYAKSTWTFNSPINSVSSSSPPPGDPNWDMIAAVIELTGAPTVYTNNQQTVQKNQNLVLGY